MPPHYLDQLPGRRANQKIRCSYDTVAGHSNMRLDSVGRTIGLLPSWSIPQTALPTLPSRSIHAVSCQGAHQSSDTLANQRRRVAASSSSTHTNATPDRGKIHPSKLTSTVLAGTVDGASSIRDNTLLAKKSSVFTRRMPASA